MVSSITTKIFATLGNNSSLVPLGVKDVSNTLGMTAGSYITGNSVEGKDRFIDEFGTQVIWLLGIPFFKEVINKTVYKAAGYNPKIDRRILENKEVFEYAQQQAYKLAENSKNGKIKVKNPQKLENVAKGFEKLVTQKGKNISKALSTGRFIAATALTMAAYSALTTFRHKHTEKNIIKEIKKEETLKKNSDDFLNEKSAIQFQSFGKKNNQKPTFGMNLSPLKQFMFDPVKNTMIIDGGITTQRLADSRNPQDFVGYVIKEGGFWAFMYFLGPEVQKHMEKRLSAKNPIDLDIRVLQDAEFKEALKENLLDINSMSENLMLHKFEKEKPETYKDVYKALYENPNNIIVKMAKKAGIIKTVKELDARGKEIEVGLQQIAPNEFVDINEIHGLKEKIKNINKIAPKKEEKAFEEFMKKTIKLKQYSIIKNIGFSIGALGILVPGIMVAMRYLGKENKDFQVKKDVHEKLKNQNNLA